MIPKNLFILMLTTALAVSSLSCNEPQDKNDITGSSDTASSDTVSEAVILPQQRTSDKNVLAGNWIRTDADYRIEISDLAEGGKMKAGYFNPGSINVSKALWNDNGGILTVYIELRDTNYPGSKYNLTFIPEKKLLAGKYFQAVEGVTYNVEFRKTDK